MSVLSRLRRRSSGGRWPEHPQVRSNPRAYRPAEVIAPAADSVERLVQQGRFGTLISERDGDRHPSGMMETVERELETRFRPVPEGYAAIPQTIHDTPGSPEIDLEVGPFHLARHTVTNAEFQWFVDAGGYSEMELWPRDLWDQVDEFVDVTGQPGPRFWRGARHDRRLANHPVVGVSYFEANAYAHWAGYRLPTEEEWQMAATWRLRSAAHSPRRFPWGDALDAERCNVWASHVGGTVEVDAYPEGSAQNGVRQLIGNVWEWTASDFDATDDEGRVIIGDMPLKSIRGGAFDTYLAAQTAGTFRTGMATMTRSPNLGFRCVLDAKAPPAPHER